MFTCTSRLVEGGIRRKHPRALGSFIFINASRLPIGARTIELYRSGLQQERSCTAKRTAKLKAEKVTKQVPISFLVDADCFGIAPIKAALKKLSILGDAVKTTVFAEPRRTESKQWKKLLADERMSFRAVSRSDDGFKDPNDEAITLKAKSLAALDTNQHIAFMVSDTDFVPHIRSLTNMGNTCIVFLPWNRPGMAKAYGNAGASVVVLTAEDMGKANTPLMMAVLGGDGNGNIQPLDGDLEDLSADMDVVADTLLGLGYLDHKGGPILQAIAKFWHTNELGSLTVWPLTLAGNSLWAHLRQQTNKEWQRSRRDLAFILPCSATRTKKKTALARYGSGQCASIAEGGGPFILSDSATLSEELLHRLNYLDSHANSNVEEALEVFAHVKMNKRNLRESGTCLDDNMRASDKLAKLRTVLLSNQVHGTWQIPNSDECLRALFASHRLLVSIDADRDEMLHAMKQYIRRHDLRNMKTYNGCVWQCILHLNRSHPSRRI